MNRRCLYFLCIVIFCVLSALYTPRIPEEPSPKRQIPEEGACEWPKIDPSAARAANLIDAPDVIRCDTGFPRPLVFVNASGYVSIDKESVARLTYLIGHSIKCSFAYFDSAPSDRMEYSYRDEFDPLSDVNDPIKVIDGDFIRIRCYHDGKKPNVIYSNVYAHGTMKNKDRAATFQRYSPADRSRFSVMIVLIDGVSLPAFQSHMPSTYDYLIGSMGASVFPGFTKVAPDANGNIMAMITGQRSSSNDTVPFIWNEYPDYLSSVHEDSVQHGFFSQRKVREMDKPSDFYYRPFYMELAKVRPHNRDCGANRILFEATIDALQRQLVVVNDTLQFNLVHFGELVRKNVANLKYLDVLFSKFLHRMHDSGFWERTMLFLVGTRGPNSGRRRQLLEGVIEERMPLLIIHAPTRLLDLHPNQRRHLAQNQRRLVTPFDVHATIRHLLNMGDNRSDRDQGEPRESFGISLLEPIGRGRTCEEAGIPSQFCPCQTIEPLDPQSDTVQGAGQGLVAHVNRILDERNVSERQRIVAASSLCFSFTLVRVVRSERFVIVDSSRRANPASNHRNRLRLLVECYPGDALFEAEMVQKSPGEWTVISDVSQLNQRDHFSKCIKDEDTKPFCICSRPSKR